MSFEMELALYHEQQQTTKNLKKCTLCNRANMLVKLPDEFQEHAAKKDYESWFCCNCLQVVNFCL